MYTLLKQTHPPISLHAAVYLQLISPMCEAHIYGMGVSLHAVETQDHFSFNNLSIIFLIHLLNP